MTPWTRTTLVLAALLLPMACVVPEGGRGPGGGSTWTGLTEPTREVERLLGKGDLDGALRAVDRFMPRSRDPDERARLELSRATALAAQGKLLSALSAHQRAAAEAAPGSAMELRALEAWADTELRTGKSRQAGERYEALLARDGLSLDDERRLLASRALAAERAGDLATSRRALARLGGRADVLLAAARQRLSSLHRPRPEPSVRHAGPRSIPSDPRALVATIRRRGDWGARSLRGNHNLMTPIRAITVHHSAMPAPGRGQAGGQLRSIQRVHQDDQGWADIGYHFLIDPEGNVWEGRRLGVQGAHAGSSGANVGNIGVCLLGNFDIGSVPGAQARALDELLDALTDWFGLRCSDVWPHKHYKTSTACPGRDLDRLVSGYRSGRPIS